MPEMMNILSLYSAFDTCDIVCPDYQDFIEIIIIGNLHVLDFRSKCVYRDWI